MTVVVQQQRRLVITPPSPPLQSGKHARSRSGKYIPLDQVESISEINFEEGETRFSVFLKNIAEGMSHSLDSSRTTNSKVISFELWKELTLA